jgi:hypothetical protein
MQRFSVLVSLDGIFWRRHAAITGGGCEEAAQRVRDVYPEYARPGIRFYVEEEGAFEKNTLKED